MSATTLDVPPAYAEWFRDAVLGEIRSDAEYVRDAVESEQRAIMAREEDRVETGDIDASMGSIRESHSLLAQAANKNPQIEGEVATVAHALEAMADKVVAPKLAAAVNVSPLDSVQAAEVRELAEAVDWAADEAARLHGQWKREREAREAVAS